MNKKNFFESSIAGINFRGLNFNGSAGLIEGIVKLDPTNEYDDTAIGIYTEDNILLGYIPKSLKKSYNNFNKTNSPLPFIGIIYKFYNDKDELKLAGSISIGENTKELEKMYEQSIYQTRREFEYSEKKINEKYQNILIEQNKSVSKFKTYLYGFLGIILCFSIPPIGIWVLYLSYKQYKKSKLI